MRPPERTRPDICCDILLFDYSAYPRDAFDFVFASCPCEAYSQLRVRAKIPRDEAMVHADRFVAKTREIIEHFSTALFCIENPGYSLLWKREVSAGLSPFAVLTDYCQFGRPFRKRTRLSSSFPITLPMCPGPGQCEQMVGNRHLVRSDLVRSEGGRTHTEIMHELPEGLCDSVLAQAERLLPGTPWAAY